MYPQAFAYWSFSSGADLNEYRILVREADGAFSSIFGSFKEWISSAVMVSIFLLAALFLQSVSVMGLWWTPAKASEFAVLDLNDSWFTCTAPTDQSGLWKHPATRRFVAVEKSKPPIAAFSPLLVRAARASHKRRHPPPRRVTWRMGQRRHTSPTQQQR